MAKFTVDPPKLAEAVTQMEHFHKAVELAVTTAESAMSQVGQSWQGEAATTGQEAYRRLHVGAEQMRQALGQLKGFLDNAHTGYTTAITQNSQMWGVE